MLISNKIKKTKSKVPKKLSTNSKKHNNNKTKPKKFIYKDKQHKRQKQERNF